MSDSLVIERKCAIQRSYFCFMKLEVLTIMLPVSMLVVLLSVIFYINVIQKSYFELGSKKS